MRKIFRPYFFISCCGLLAFAPVSFMLRALKNDIVALEYPINHFISQSIRHGELPYWFNTWGMGFPLQSNLTWSIHSTPQVLFSSIFNYDMYALHIEFIFFILMAGWSMYYLLRRFFFKDENLTILLAVAYMLSGFMVGSTQWMLYITAAAFLPVFISALLSLLAKPSWRTSIQAAICFTMMFTSVYAAFNIISLYGILVFLVIYLIRGRQDKRLTMLRLRFLMFSAAIALLFCLPCLYGTFELLKNISRGDSITGTSLFDSNYLHPGALGSMLLPFSSVRMHYPNTEGTMLDTYAGLIVLLTIPIAIRQSLVEKNKIAWTFLVAAIVFLVTAFGSITPLRNLLNNLPGFSYFRNAAIFRFYFLLLLILFIASALKNYTFSQLTREKILRWSILCLLSICGLVLIVNLSAFSDIRAAGISDFIKTISSKGSMVISAAIQTVILALLFVLVFTKKTKLAGIVFAGDLILNSLICTPFFSVSSYTPGEVNKILHITNGFPVQEKPPSGVKSSEPDQKGNLWQNTNVFSKEVSGTEAYYGPLVLKNNIMGKPELANRPLVFAQYDSTATAVTLILQKPSHVRVKTNLLQPGPVTLQQNHYSGWKVYVNGKKQPFILCYGPAGNTKATLPGLSVEVPAGESIIDFKYRPNVPWIWILIIHAAILSYCLWKLFALYRRYLNRSSSPSSPN